MKQEETYVGIDVAKARVDIATRPGGDVWSVDYDEQAVSELVSSLLAMEPTMVLLEATGGLEVPLVSALAAAALPVVVVNPRQVRDFARATGKLAKTDALDAQVLAHFAEAVRPSVRPLRDADTQELNFLTTRRSQLVTMLVSEKNRLGRASHSVRPRIQSHITWLEQELSDLENDLREALRRSPVWREKDDLLRSVPGVGEQLSLSLLAYLPELGTLKPQADRRSGWGSALQSGQRSSSGQAQCLGWENPSASHTLHGCTERQPIQSGAQSLLSAAVGGWKAQEGGTDGLHAKASDHTQCDDQKWSTLDSPGQHILTNNTVATAIL